LLPSLRFASLPFMNVRPQLVLTIAAADPGSGAGIQGDLKAIHANGGYALCVITAITAQNSHGVTSVHPLPASVVEAQLASVFEDFPVAAVKTGMLGTAEIVRSVARVLVAHPDPPLVIDPVLTSTSGRALLDAPGTAALRRELLPLARVCTPNRPEAEVLAEMKIGGIEEAAAAARHIVSLGARAAVVTGGHIPGSNAEDVLVDGASESRHASPRVEGPSVHGTGCAFSAALATWLARGLEMRPAVERAKAFVRGAILGASPTGGGAPPANAFFFLRGEDWTSTSRT